jgi:DNA excision repair protein ERCC-2
MRKEGLFPYPEIRPAQREMIQAVKEALKSHQHLVIEGPTGMGKTVAVLCGVLESPQVERLKIVYCCRTHRQMDRVIEELLAMKTNIPALSMRGKREMCLNRLMRFTSSSSEAAYVCSLLKREGKCELFENLLEENKKFLRLVREFSNRPVFAGEILSACKESDFCPYELARELTREAKIVAASYIYILDPHIREGFLAALRTGLDNLVLIFDEAHNIPTVASELASDKVTSSSISQAVREAEEMGEKKLSQDLQDWLDFLEKFAKQLFDEEEGEKIIKGDEIISELKNPSGLAEKAEETGENIILQRIERGRAPRSHLRHLAQFLRAWMETRAKEEYLHIFSSKRKGEETILTLELSALDPRLVTQQVLRCYCSISMSGTLAPLQAYREIVGLPEQTLLLELPSPFPPENVLCLVTEGVTTKEEFRLPRMYEKITSKLVEVCEATPANVGIFTASYEVLEGLLKAGLGEKIKKPLFVENPEMSSTENDRIVKEFKSFANRGGAVLLGVIGGRNSEGGDFPGNEMNSVAVVGIPYAPPDPRTEAAIRYYEKQFPGRGKFYAYYLPAHRKMCQAAGRAHRLVTDRAAIIFLDRRVLTKFVARSLPSWMRRKLERVPDRQGVLRRRLEEFFRPSPSPHPSSVLSSQTVPNSA